MSLHDAPIDETAEAMSELEVALDELEARARAHRPASRRPTVSRRPPPSRPRPGQRPWRPGHQRPRPWRRAPLPVYGATTVVDEPLPPVTAASEYVRWVQSALNRVLGLRLPVDGVMGPETRSAIRSFQKRHGLATDGIVGPDTEEALREAARAVGSRP
jgi:hypothetical protein